jgi:3-mercaptopyruvate sulfurtransferase SseA
VSEDVTTEELRSRLGEDGLTLLDVRTAPEFDGVSPTSCDLRHGHIEGARNLPLHVLLECSSIDGVRELIGLPEGAKIVAYCHTGIRSGHAVQVLSAAGYDARNYVSSWHEWSRDASLPAEP